MRTTSLQQKLSVNDIDWCARRLLGAEIVRHIGGRTHIAKIVETESYDQSDPASHSYSRTPRSEVMYGPAGQAYVYFIYGRYYCLNIVCGPVGFGAGVLIRAAEPLGVGKQPENLMNGPGKLCRALFVDKSFNGHDLCSKPLQIKLNPELLDVDIMSAKRIGLKRSLHAKKRFYVKNNPYISRP